MIGPDELRATTLRADMGYFWLWVLVLVVLLCLWAVGRWGGARAALAAFREWAGRPHPLLWITLGGALLRIPHLGDALWYDEAYTAQVTTLPLANFLPAVRGDVHPPGWYAVDWIAAQLLGNSETALRFPAFIFGVLLILYAHRLAKAAGLSEKTALVFAALIAVLPAALYYSSEARGYTMLALLAFGALIGLLENRPGVFALHAAFLPLTHNIGYAYLGLFSLAAWWQWRRELRRIAITLPALLPGLLWLPSMMAQSGEIADGFWLQPLNPGLALSIYTDMTMMRSYSNTAAAVVISVAIGVTLVAFFSYWRWLVFDPRGRLVGLLIVGVPASVALVSLLWAPVYLTRGLLPVGLGAAMLWAMLIVEKPLSRFAIVPIIAIALVNFYTPGMVRYDMRAVMDGCRDSVGAYATGMPAAMFQAYYLPDAELRVWPGAGDLNQAMPLPVRQMMNLRDGRFEDLPEGRRCLLALETPHTTDAERAEIARVLAAHPHRITVYEINPYYTVRVIEL